MDGLLPYQQSPFAQIGGGIADLIPLILGAKMLKDKMTADQSPIGSILGYPKAPTDVPTPGPIASMGRSGTTVPIGQPNMGADGMMTAVKPPLSYPTAPAAIQPLLSQPLKNLSSLRHALGDTQMTSILASLGIGKGGDTMQLQWDPDKQSFSFMPGVTKVTSKNANVILRQKDINSKQDLGKWRDAVEQRLKRGQMSREEMISMGADRDMLNFMLSPQFDLVDDTLKQHFQSQATAAVNRLQQRGVKVFTGERARKAGGTPAAPAPLAPTPGDTRAQRMKRYNEIKTQNPTLTDDQIAAQIAIEEQGQ